MDKDVIYDDAHDGARPDQVTATNQLTFAQGDVTYLSRADGFANYAEATAVAPVNHSLSAQALADYASAATFDAAKYDDPKCCDADHRGA